MAHSSLRLAAKDLVRRIVPHSRSLQLRECYNRLTWRFYAGDSVACNCCEGRFRRFRSWTDDTKVLWPMCPRCGSLGRMRVDWLYLTTRTDLLEAPKRVLHVAPEACLRRLLEGMANISYLSADYDSSVAMERMDVMDIRHAEESFDVIICNHVLEHVADDRRAMREIFRVLRRGGWALLQVPLDGARDHTFEDHAITDPRERQRVFGQYDHVRIYGRDYPQRLLEAGFEVSADEFAKSLPTTTLDEFGLDAEETIYLARKR